MNPWIVLLFHRKETVLIKKWSFAQNAWYVQYIPSHIDMFSPQPRSGLNFTKLGCYGRLIYIFPCYWDIHKQCYLKVPIASYLSWKFHRNSPKTHRSVSVLRWGKGVKKLLRIFTWWKPFMGMAKKDEEIWVGCYMILVLQSLPCMNWA